jgi:hypothetical protein
MSEGTCANCAIGSTIYENSYVTLSNGTSRYVTSIVSYFRHINAYGSVCSDSAYSSLGAWTNGPTYGYSEPSFTTHGQCAYSYYHPTESGPRGIYHDPVNSVGGPDNAFTQMRAPNSGDSAHIYFDFGRLVPGPGSLSIYGYSYGISSSTYNSTVNVYISNNNSTWVEYVKYWNPSSNNTPSWNFIVGPIYNIRYVEVEVVYANGHSANIYLDALSIQ